MVIGRGPGGPSFSVGGRRRWAMVSAENPVLVKISADLTGYMIIGGITMAFPPIFLVFKKSALKMRSIR